MLPIFDQKLVDTAFKKKFEKRKVNILTSTAVTAVEDHGFANGGMHNLTAVLSDGQ